MKQAVTLIIPLVVLTPGLILSAEYLKPKVKTHASPALTTTTTLVEEKSTHGKSFPAESLYQLLAAEMALDRDQPEIALVNYIAAARQTQDPGVAQRATEIALSMGSLPDAIVASSLWAKIASNNLDAQITTAALYIRQDQTTKALPYLQKAIQLNSQQAYEYFVILYGQLPDKNDNARFIKALKMLSTDFNYDTAHLALAQIYLKQNQSNAALKMSQEALKINPHSYQAITLYAQALLNIKGKAQAKAFLEEKMKENANNNELRYYFAQFLKQQEYTEDALKESELVFKNEHFSPNELIDFGRFCTQAAWYPLAEKAFLKAKQNDETRDISYYFLARVAQLQNNDKKAIEWFKQVLTGPFHVISQIRASLLLAEKSKYDEALTILSRTQPSSEAERKQLILSRVDILNQSKAHDKAMTLLNESLKQNPNETDFLYARGLIADEIGNEALAEKDLKQIIALDSDNINALNALGFILANKTTRLDEAKTYLTHAFSLSPNNASVLDSLGWLYYKMGDNQKAAEMLEKAVSIQPDADISAHLGEVLWHMKEFAKAKSVWQNAITQFPQHKLLQAIMSRYLSAQQAENAEKKP